MATAGDQINLALGLIGQLAEGETPSAATAQLGLTVLNQMLDSWSTERLSVFCTDDQIFTWPSNQATRTLGPSGDFVGTRPVLLDESTYFKASSGLSLPITFINQEQYNSIAVKTTTSTYPNVAFVNMGFPNITITVYPVPTQALEWHFVSVQTLTRATSLATTLSFPLGYDEAFSFNLACKLAPFFGVSPSAEVKSTAMASKRTLRRINNPNDVMSIPSAILSTPSRFNIFTGQPL